MLGNDHDENWSNMAASESRPTQDMSIGVNSPLRSCNVELASHVGFCSLPQVVVGTAVPSRHEDLLTVSSKEKSLLSWFCRILQDQLNRSHRIAVLGGRYPGARLSSHMMVFWAVMKPCRQPGGMAVETGTIFLFCAGVVRQGASRWAVEAVSQSSQCTSHRLAGSAACLPVSSGRRAGRQRG